MACGGVENSGGPVGFQERDDIADQFVFGEDLGFAQAEEFLNPRQWLETGVRQSRDGDFLSIGKTSPVADFAGSAVRQPIEAGWGALGWNPAFLVPGETLAKWEGLLHG